VNFTIRKLHTDYLSIITTIYFVVLFSQWNKRIEISYHEVPSQNNAMSFPWYLNNFLLSDTKVSLWWQDDRLTDSSVCELIWVTQTKKADKERLARLFLAHLIVYHATRFYVTVPFIITNAHQSNRVSRSRRRSKSLWTSVCLVFRRFIIDKLYDGL